MQIQLEANAGLDDGPLEKGVRRPGIPPLRKGGVTHRTIVVDRPLDVRGTPINYGG
jgi:hypothetical protein